MVIQYIFYFLIFPGFLFILAAGLMVSWAERKLTARLQWRQGPPLLQPFYDLQKLFIKETLLPVNAYHSIYILMPLLAFSGMLLAGTWLGLLQ
ncbi:MAG TPA: NADH-quinone oxidoreductase subunit H, partial [bacterium]|nr:NADH-quinone oxidoreductase subunit H [bacterium]